MVSFVRLSDDGEHNVVVPATVRAGPQDGHAAARRRRQRREAHQADREVPGQHLRHAGGAALRHAGTVEHAAPCNN